MSVLLFHFFATSLRLSVPFFAGPWFRAAADGPFAVLVFFLLSADALTTAYLASATSVRLRLVVGRWPRLVFPIAVSSLAVFLLLLGGWTFSGPASKVLGVESWLGRFLDFRPGDATGLARYVLFDVFRHSDPATDYNPFLWSMSTELKGSFLVFLDLFLFRKVPLRWHLALLAALAAGLMLAGTHLCLFPIGISLALLRAEGLLTVWRNKAIARACGWILPICVVAWITFGGSPLESYRAVVAAPLLVFGIYSNPTLLEFFRSRVSRFLGRISFPLYVLQFPVLVSLSSYLFLSAASHGPLRPGTAVSISVVSCLVAATLAWALSFLDEAFQRGLRRFLEGRWSR